MCAKVTVSVPDELLDRIDAIADEIGTSRSGVIQEASARYVIERETGEAHAARRVGTMRLLEMSREIASRPARDGRDSLEILYEVRGQSDLYAQRYGAASEEPEHGEDV